jgi:hypothetical protein
MANRKFQTDLEDRLAKLFGSISRARILSFLLANSGMNFYQREIMFETGLSLHPTQRELENLVDLEIVHSPFFKPLCEICESAQKKQ